VQQEFLRNKDRIAKESAKSLASHFKVVKEAIGVLGQVVVQRKSCWPDSMTIDHQIPILGGGRCRNIGQNRGDVRQRHCLKGIGKCKMRAGRSAINKSCPFHRERNSMA